MKRKYISLIVILIVIWMAGCGVGISNRNDDEENIENQFPVGDLQIPDVREPFESNGDREPPDDLSAVLRRLETLKPEDVKSFGDKPADANTIVPLINAEAQNVLDSAVDTSSMWRVSLYLSENQDEQHEQIHFSITTRTHIVAVSYYTENKEAGTRFDLEFRLQAPLLWDYIYALYCSESSGDEEALAMYGGILSERAQWRMDYHNTNLVQEGFPALTGFEIAELRLVDSFSHNGLGYLVYRWDAGFFTDDPNPGRYGWPQDAYVDEQGCIRSYDWCCYFVTQWISDNHPMYDFFDFGLYNWSQLDAHAQIVEHFTGEKIYLEGTQDGEQTVYTARGVSVAIPDSFQNQIGAYCDCNIWCGAALMNTVMNPTYYPDNPYMADQTLFALHHTCDYWDYGNGLIFSIWRYTEEEYRTLYLNSCSRQSVFAKDETYCYCVFLPTDEQHTDPKTAEIIGKLLDQQLSKLLSDMIERNGWQAYDGEAHDDGNSLETVSYYKISNGFLYQPGNSSVVAINGGTPITIPMTEAQVKVNHNGWEITVDYSWAKYGNALAADSHSGYYSVIPLVGSDRYLQLVLDMGYTYLIDTITGEVRDPLAALDSEITQRLSFVNFSPDGQYAVISHHSGTECILLNCTTDEVTQLPYASDIYSVSGHFIDETHIMLSSAFEVGVPHDIQYSLTRYDIITGEITELSGQYTAKDKSSSNFLAFCDDGAFAYTLENGYFVIVDLMTWERTLTQFKISGLSHIFYCEDALAGVVYEGMVYILDHEGNAHSVCNAVNAERTPDTPTGE